MILVYNRGARVQVRTIEVEVRTIEVLAYGARMTYGRLPMGEQAAGASVERVSSISNGDSEQRVTRAIVSVRIIPVGICVELVLCMIVSLSKMG